MRQLTLRRIFAAPLALAALTAVGLLSALIGDGLWDAASWLMLGLPAAVSLWLGWGARGSRVS